MTETNENGLLASEGVAVAEGDAATGDAKSTPQRGRGRKLRTPFRRRRGDAQADTPVGDSADAAAESAAGSSAGDGVTGDVAAASAPAAGAPAAGTPAAKPARA